MGIIRFLGSVECWRGKVLKVYSNSSENYADLDFDDSEYECSVTLNHQQLSKLIGFLQKALGDLDESVTSGS